MRQKKAEDSTQSMACFVFLLLRLFDRLPQQKTGVSNLGSEAEPDLEDFEKIDVNESPAWRTDYYQRKFKISEPEKRPEAVQAVVRKYIEGLQWTLYYYFKGLASWSWFYPYHYTPLVIDLIDLTSLNMTFNFAKGQPFLPFQQLMAVLPPQSAQLVPKALRGLMKEVRFPFYFRF